MAKAVKYLYMVGYIVSLNLFLFLLLIISIFMCMCMCMCGVSFSGHGSLRTHGKRIYKEDERGYGRIAVYAAIHTYIHTYANKRSLKEDDKYILCTADFGQKWSPYHGLHVLRACADEYTYSLQFSGRVYEHIQRQSKYTTIAAYYLYVYFILY